MRDTFIAALLGDHDSAHAILQGQQANLTFTDTRPDPAQIEIAHELLDEWVDDHDISPGPQPA